jgi:hypothetical protein
MCAMRVWCDIIITNKWAVRGRISSAEGGAGAMQNNVCAMPRVCVCVCANRWRARCEEESQLRESC